MNLTEKATLIVRMLVKGTSLEGWDIKVVEGWLSETTSEQDISVVHFDEVFQRAVIHIAPNWDKTRCPNTLAENMAHELAHVVIGELFECIPTSSEVVRKKVEEIVMDRVAKLWLESKWEFLNEHSPSGPLAD